VLWIVAVEGDERFTRLQAAWAETVQRRRNGEQLDASLVQDALEAWAASECRPAIDWVNSRMAAGDDPGPWFAGWDHWLEILIDADDDPRAKLIDTVRLEHQGFTGEQIRRLARHAPQIVDLDLEEIEDDDEKLAGLFPGSAPWQRLRRLRIDSCEHNKALMPGLATTQLPALTEVIISNHWDAYKLADASWLRTVELMSVTYGSRNPHWLGPINMPRLEELTLDVEPTEVATAVGALADRALKPRLARLMFQRLPADFVLPVVAGMELVRHS
jgi:hypothetical protein